MVERLLKVAEVAERIGCSEKSVYRYLSDGRIPSVRPGGPNGSLRVEASDLDAFLRTTPPRHAAGWADEPSGTTAAEEIPATGAFLRELAARDCRIAALTAALVSAGVPVPERAA